MRLSFVCVSMFFIHLPALDKNVNVLSNCALFGMHACDKRADKSTNSEHMFNLLIQLGQLYQPWSNQGYGIAPTPVTDVKKMATKMTAFATFLHAHEMNITSCWAVFLRGFVCDVHEDWWKMYTHRVWTSWISLCLDGIVFGGDHHHRCQSSFWDCRSRSPRSPGPWISRADF